MKNLPERIYLNIGDEVPSDSDFRELSEVTWSEERVFDNDIAFTRKPQWKSVEEQLPSNDDNVLVYVSSTEFHIGDYEVAYYDGEDWYTSDGEHIRPTLFMYIPSLPDTNTEKK